MKEFFLKTITSLIVLLLVCHGVKAQDTIPRSRKNVIKLNFSAGLIYNTPVVFEYERVVKKNQSFAIQGGYVQLPVETDIDSLRFTKNIHDYGFNITLDYRFYLSKENKYEAPHGIYLAPFISYHHFYNERDLEFTNDSNAAVPLNLKATYNFLGIGGALGYQFVLGKRWTIDCVLLGPSLCNYNVKMVLTGEVSQDDINEIERSILYKLANRYPFFSRLLSDDIASFNGSINSLNYGFRYSLHIGFLF